MGRQIVLYCERESALQITGGKKRLPSSASLYLMYASQERSPHMALSPETCKIWTRPQWRHLASPAGAAKQTSLCESCHVHSASSVGNGRQVRRKAWMG